jgi:hypothetical protein
VRASGEPAPEREKWQEKGKRRFFWVLFGALELLVGRLPDLIRTRQGSNLQPYDPNHILGVCFPKAGLGSISIDRQRGMSKSFKTKTFRAEKGIYF